MPAQPRAAVGDEPLSAIRDTTALPRPTTHAGSSSLGRLRGLDGLRGIGALAVVLSHCLHVFPGLARLNGPAPAAGDPWWLARTPLHLLWAGTEAIYVLFLASGLVLALPMLGDRMRSGRVWAVYYPRRLARLYLPAAASVLLALLLVWAVPRREIPGFSWWFNGHAEALTATGLVRDFTLIAGNTWLNSPLWSTRWTITFALALPLYVVAAEVFSRLWGLAVAGLAATVTVAALWQVDALFYLSIFAIGVIAARHLPAIMRGAATWSGARWAFVAVTALALFQVRWLYPDLPVSHLTTLAASCLVVLMFLSWPPVVRFGERRSLQWLGGISFSLYLVHDPIVVSVANLSAWLGPAGATATCLLVGAPICVGVAWAFQRWCEGPCHHLSKTVGVSAGRWYDALTGKRQPQGARGRRRLEPTVTR